MSESMPSIEETTEVIRDEGSPFREEICRATGCSRTGPPSRYGEQGQTFRSASEQGADTLEGGCRRGWRRLERQRDSACAGHVDRTVERVRQQLVEEGFESILTRKHNPNSARKRIFDGEKEARLIALACSSPPAGRARWTLQLLEEKVVELAIVDHASDNTIGRVLKKTF